MNQKVVFVNKWDYIMNFTKYVFVLVVVTGPQNLVRPLDLSTSDSIIAVLFRP